MKKLAMVVFSLAMLIACRMSEVKEISSMSATPQYSIEDAERIARIKIPADAYEVQVYTETGWMDDAALIKFKLPSKKLQAFLDEYGFQDLKKGYWSFQDWSSVEWWPNRGEDGEPPISNYLGGELQFPGYVQKIVVDVSNPDVYTVYLQCFEV